MDFDGWTVTVGTDRKNSMDTRTLSLEKDGHLYLFCYGKGQEDALVEELMRQADDSSLNFDWMDAAALSFQLTQLSAQGAMGVLEPGELTME